MKILLATVFVIFYIITAEARHPCDPLSSEEISQVRVLVLAATEGEEIYFISIIPKEPPKTRHHRALYETSTDGERGADSSILSYRKALAIIISRTTQRSSEFLINLVAGNVESRNVLPPDVQPMITPGEFEWINEALLADPGVQSRVAELGLSMDLLFFDIWAPGDKCAEHPEFCGKRLATAFPNFREFAGDNAFAHPLPFLPIVDILARQVVAIDELPVFDDYNRTRFSGPGIELPHTSYNYDPSLLAENSFRSNIRPLTTTSEGGPSFKISDGYRVDWQGYRLRIGFNVRECLTLHVISYREVAEKHSRHLIYRMAFSEMIVPYADPRPPFYKKGAFDQGEYGLCFDVNSLIRGVDCPPQSHMMDVVINDVDGNPVTVPNGICIAEMDGGILHRHTVDGKTIVARAQELHIMFAITSTNYDYLYHFIFQQDGTIRTEIGLSGILSPTLLLRNSLPWGTLVAEKVLASCHQHIFCLRIDTAFDGEKNSVSVVDVETMPDDPETNPFGNGFISKETPLTTSLDVTDANLESNRVWKIFNPKSYHPVTGTHRAYKLITNNRPVALASPNSLVIRRAGFAQHSTWVTQYRENEIYAGGDYPNQRETSDGVSEWVKRDESIVGKDIVLWHTFAFTHTPSSDEFSLMSVEKTGIILKPCNFFNTNPGLTIPPPTAAELGQGSAKVPLAEVTSSLPVPNPIPAPIVTAF